MKKKLLVSVLIAAIAVVCLVAFTGCGRGGIDGVIYDVSPDGTFAVVVAYKGM